MFYGQYTGFGGGVAGNQSLLEILTALGLTSDLKLCLDAGDSTSYTSGLDWVDRSGNLGSDEFHRGSTTASDANDPTFNGAAGGLSSAEYFSFDGGDSFNYGGGNTLAYPDMTANDSPSGTAEANNEYDAGRAAWKMFDYDDSSDWSTQSQGAPWWVSYEFTANKTIVKYRLLPRSDTVDQQTPKDFLFQGWNGSAWVTLDTQTSQTSWTAGSFNEYIIGADGSPNVTGYIKYRMYSTANQGPSTAMSMNGLEMMEAGNESWMNSFHKNNAILAVAMWVYDPGGTNHAYFGTGDFGHGIGSTFYRTGDDDIVFRVGKGSADYPLTVTNSVSINTSAWNFIGVALDESVGSNGGFLYLNGTEQLFTSTYSSPSAVDAANTMRIGTTGASSGDFINNTRLAEVAIWSGGTVLTPANFDDIYAKTKGRFGL